ncbi:hypothetical protein Tco_0613892 [Tanacetum coccineum]
MINNNNNNKTRGRILTGPTLQDLVRRNLTEDLNLCILNETITTMVHVLLNSTSATELAIWPAIVEVLQILMIVTIRGALGQVRNLLAMNVEPRDISRGIAKGHRRSDLKDVHMFEDFSIEVFPKYCWDFLRTRQVEFPNDLVPGAALCSTLPLSIGASEMKELSEQT